MDLVSGVQTILVLMDHVDKNGRPKLVERCGLPLTGAGVVDIVITDRGRFEIDKSSSRLRLTMIAPRDNVEGIQAITLAPIDVQLG